MSAKQRTNEARTITVTIAPGIAKGTVAFQMVSKMPRPLPKRKAPEIQRAIGVSRSTFDQVLRLRRFLDANPSTWEALELEVMGGRLSPRQALGVIEDVQKKQRKKGAAPAVQRPRANAAKVFLCVSALHEPLPFGLLAAVQRGMNVSQSVVMDALRLSRLFRQDEALCQVWRPKALSGELSARTILQKIAAAKNSQPSR